jgi:hypothetical protein
MSAPSATTITPASVAVPAATTTIEASALSLEESKDHDHMTQQRLEPLLHKDHVVEPISILNKVDVDEIDGDDYVRSITHQMTSINMQVMFMYL